MRSLCSHRSFLGAIVHSLDVNTSIAILQCDRFSSSKALEAHAPAANRDAPNAAVHLRRTERPEGARPGGRCNGLFGAGARIHAAQSNNSFYRPRFHYDELKADRRQTMSRIVPSLHNES